MTIKCSVFGHRFGDAEVTREREERGSEVVTTITETETCERCGETRVVSENTEVTTLETPSDIVEEATGDGNVDDGGEAPTPEKPDAAEPEGLIEEAENRGASAATAGGGSVGTGHGRVTEPGPRDEDDAVILDEPADADAEEDENDGESRAPGEWPDQTEEEDADEEWVPDMTSATETGTGTEGLPSVESEQPDIERTGQAATVPEGEFHCPECGFTTAVESSSLREGDFCPECHRGSLEHSPEE